MATPGRYRGLRAALSLGPPLVAGPQPEPPARGMPPLQPGKTNTLGDHGACRGKAGWLAPRVCPASAVTGVGARRGLQVPVDRGVDENLCHVQQQEGQQQNPEPRRDPVHGGRTLAEILAQSRRELVSAIGACELDVHEQETGVAAREAAGEAATEAATATVKAPAAAALAAALKAQAAAELTAAQQEKVAAEATAECRRTAQTCMLHARTAQSEGERADRLEAELLQMKRVAQALRRENGELRAELDAAGALDPRTPPL
jgi:hypothetical protein